jgi:Protein of unknown function (DUF732)
MLAAVAIAITTTATTLAAPAYADEQLDQMFLKGLQQKGITMAPGDALSLASSTCDILSHGNPNAALTMIVKRTKWSTQQATNFAGVAVYAYCRDKMPGGGNS